MPNIKLLTEQAREMYDHLETLEPEEFLSELAEIQQKGMQVVAPLCDIIDELTLRGEARSTLAAQYSELAANDKKRVENIKASILWIMNACGQKKLDNGSLQVSVNPGRESLEIVDEALVPEKYKRATVQFPLAMLESVKILLGGDLKEKAVDISKTAIKDEIKAYASQHEGQSLGVAGTQIIKKPYITIKG